MLGQVKATIRKYCMFAPGDKVLVGVSGGPDSVALVHILSALADQLQVEICIAHLDHGFRGRESEEDAEFVRNLAGVLGLRAVVEARDVAGFARKHNLSAQAAAREVRYGFFAEAARLLGCNKLATGHNANDQAETVLQRFLRGSGPAGLGGIPPVRDGWIVRPLIETSRTEIEKYCIDNNLPTRLDRSNLKTVYTRNKIRLQLIPLLEKEYNPNIVETLVRTGEIMRDEDRFLEETASEYWAQTCLRQAEGEIAFDLERFLRLPPAIQGRLIRKAWGKLTGDGHNIEYVHLTGAVELIRNGRTGAARELPQGIILTKSYEQFLLTGNLDGQNSGLCFFYTLNIPGSIFINETGDTLQAEVLENQSDFLSEKLCQDEIAIDLDKVSLPIAVRSRRPGDRFKPPGMQGSKKLKDFLIDSKVPRHSRDRIPILVTGDDQIIWIAGLREDRRWQVGRETERILKLKLMRNIQKQN